MGEESITEARLLSIQELRKIKTMIQSQVDKLDNELKILENKLIGIEKNFNTLGDKFDRLIEVLETL